MDTGIRSSTDRQPTREGLARRLRRLEETAAPLAGCSLLHTILLPLVPILTVVLVMTALRLWYDSLVAPWVMHLLVNVWGLTLTIGLMPIPW